MAKTKACLFLTVCLLLIAINTYADNIFVLYGFKIGQNISTSINQLGKPSKTHKFEDGFSYMAFKMKDHFVAIEFDNIKPDLIYAIQIQGKRNPPSLGLDGIDLGDPIVKAIKIFGKPDSTKQAVDEVTKKPMKDIVYYSYNESRNFSIEATKEIVTSIKILRKDSDNNTESMIDFKQFLSTIRSKDLNKISRYIDTDFEFIKDQTYKMNTSIIHTLINNKTINNIFFNPDYGIISIKDKDIAESALRVQSDPIITGYVFKIKKSNIEYELFFSKNYDGWVLKYIDQFR